MSLQDKQESSRYEAYRLRKSKLHEDIRRLNDDLQSVGEAEQQKKSEIIRIKDRLKAQLENLKAKEQDSVKVERDAIYRKYLSSARFVFGTLSAFGADTVASNLIGEIDVCVIDEAAQAIEVSALIPLQFSPKRLVLVGDPQQLPAVVKSVAAKRARFDLSLMERLQLIGSVPTCMLCEQYRMDARIAEFPSNQFYEGKLITGPSLLRSANPLESLFVKNSPVLFFNCSSQSGSGDIKQGTSLINATEARIVASLVHFLQDQHLDVSIGVISPYRQQVGLLRKLIDSGAEIDSVDAFQGREKDVIIFSCVRASGSSMGFLADVRRLNVAITRAKKAVWIVGNSDFLRANGGRVWEALVESCENNESVIPACRVEELTERRLAKKVKILNDI
jgi:senataxin